MVLDKSTELTRIWVWLRDIVLANVVVDVCLKQLQVVKHLKVVNEGDMNVALSILALIAIVTRGLFVCFSCIHLTPEVSGQFNILDSLELIDLLDTSSSIVAIALSEFGFGYLLLNLISSILNTEQQAVANQANTSQELNISLELAKNSLGNLRVKFGKIWLSLRHLNEVQISHNRASSKVLLNYSIIVGSIDIKDAA